MNGRKPSRTPLYSRSPTRTPPGESRASAPPGASGASDTLRTPAAAGAARATVSATATPPRAAAPQGALRARLRRVPAWGWAVFGALLVALPAWVGGALRPGAPALTQRQIDAAVLHALNTQPLPSAATKAYEAVAPSVVRVIGRAHPPGEAPPDAKAGAKNGSAKPKTEDQRDDDEDGAAVGSGVVIVDSGIILTNLHVVAGSRHIEVVFADGLTSGASVINVMPENDLAVLRAHRIPDDLKSATMRSTADLKPGDRVTAVGFPFGIGPTVSHGVVSGLKREFRSSEGERLLTNLIQFDAMANPGSSGGPLVTDDGEVVGIVTAIYNPVQQRFFVGIGFAVPIESAAAGAGLPPF
jgi:S1-C subfamily serine protease